VVTATISAQVAAIPTSTLRVDLPTPTPNRTASLLPTPTAQPGPTQATDVGSGLLLLPTLTPTPAGVTELPAPTPVPTSMNYAGSNEDAGALPAAYVAQGTYASTTVYPDGTTAQQQGNFTIVQAPAPNLDGYNQQITLTTRRADGLTDVIQVYLVDDYILVDYGDGAGGTTAPTTGQTTPETTTWTVVRRAQGSGLVRAIQPISDLALFFPRVVEQAEFIGADEIAGQETLHYRIQGESALGARLVQPLLGITGDFRALQLDAWLAIPGGYVVRYSFQVDLEDARVLDAARNEVRADQAVTWTYQLSPLEQPPAITWPAQAPRPDAWPIAGFAPGEFPLPPDTTFVSAVDNVIELQSTAPVATVADFYRGELSRLGWTVTGQNALLQVSKAQAESFELLLEEDQTGPGSTITVLSTEDSRR
jgi:hypothetical protein